MEKVFKGNAIKQWEDRNKYYLKMVNTYGVAEKGDLEGGTYPHQPKMEGAHPPPKKKNHLLGKV